METGSWGSFIVCPSVWFQDRIPAIGPLEEVEPFAEPVSLEPAPKARGAVFALLEPGELRNFGVGEDHR
jgi:hypothetical protein